MPVSRLAYTLLLSAVAVGMTPSVLAQPVTLRVQTGSDFFAADAAGASLAYRAAHERFVAENPDVTVEYEIVPQFELLKQFLVAAEAGNAPDVTFQGAANTYTLAVSGRVRSLNDYIANHAHLNVDNMASAILDTETVDGNVYGIPTTTDARLLYFRRDLMAEAGIDAPPATREELIKVAQALTRDTNGDGTPDQWGFCYVGDNSLHMPHMWLVHAWAGGGDLLDDNGKAIYNGPAGVAAAQFYSDLVNVYRVTPSEALAFDYETTLRSLVGGQCAMAVLGSWSWRIDLSGALGESIGWTRVPPPEGGEQATFSGGWSWMIAKDSKVPDAAWRYIETLNSPETDAELAKFNIPTRQSVVKDMDASDFLAQAAVYATEAAHGNPQAVYTQALFDGIRAAVQNVVQGRATAQEALDSAAAEYNRRYAR